MPTAARLMGAISLSLVAYILSRMIMPLMPDGTDFSYFVLTNMALGLVAGWVVMGPRAGGDILAGIGNGLTGVFILVLWGLTAQAILEMLSRSLQRRYDGLGEAFLAVLNLGAEYFLVMATLPIAVAIIVGGAVAGILTNLAKARWR